MKKHDTHKSVLFSDPVIFQEAMIRDIALAESYIYLEIYKFRNDESGIKFRDALAERAEKGIKVKVLVDSWGTDVSEVFFEPVVRLGGEVRFFKKIRFFIDFFTKNHRRNHRKLLIIDDKITYLGSANINAYSLKWRELMLRLDGPITLDFKKTFQESFRLYRKYIFNKFAFKKPIVHGDFEIVQDLPSIYRQLIKKRYETLFRKAKHEIFIETPYFLPGYKLRRIMMLAARRGVNVNVIIPLHSDVRSVDFLRGKYMEFYYKNNIHIHHYTAGNLHAKCVLVDNEIFAIGSANFDYRSFRYQHEIMLFGKNREIISQLKAHIQQTLEMSIPFDYDSWRTRPLFEKVMGWLLIPFRHLF